MKMYLRELHLLDFFVFRGIGLRKVCGLETLEHLVTNQRLIQRNGKATLSFQSHWIF